MPDDLRKLKDEAAKAVERGKYRRAGELYDVLTTREADPLWPHRAGEAYRRAGLLAEAVERLAMAAEGYEGQGFISKAIAVCKMILEVDPKHAVAQERLARLGPRRNTPLMMPAVNADGVPIRSASELSPPGGPPLALDKAPAAGSPRPGNELVALDAPAGLARQRASARGLAGTIDIEDDAAASLAVTETAHRLAAKAVLHEGGQKRVCSS